MYKVEGYLAPLYKDSNYYTKFLEYFGAHICINSIEEELKTNFTYNNSLTFEEYFNFIFTKAYNTLASKLPTYSNYSRLTNVYAVNKLQYKRLAKSKLRVSYPAVDLTKVVDDELLHRKEVKLIQEKFPNIKTRTLVLYHRSDASDYLSNDMYFGVDIFQLILIYRTIFQLIKDNKTALFNNIQIVSRYNNLPDIVIEALSQYTLSENNSCINNCSGIDFQQRTCIFSNTFHFYGGEIPDSNLYTIPIITYLHILQKKFITLIKNKHFIPFLYYPGFVTEKGAIMSLPDKDFLREDRLVATEDLISKDNLIIKNASVMNIISEIISGVLSVENKLLNDEIYDKE